MAEDMELYLEEMIKITNPQEYIKILEQDREDFAEEINKLQNRIDKALEYIEQILEFIISKNIKEEKREYERLEHIVNILKGDNK